MPQKQSRTLWGHHKQTNLDIDELGPMPINSPY